MIDLGQRFWCGRPRRVERCVGSTSCAASPARCWVGGCSSTSSTGATARAMAGPERAADLAHLTPPRAHRALPRSPALRSCPRQSLSDAGPTERHPDRPFGRCRATVCCVTAAPPSRRPGSWCCAAGQARGAHPHGGRTGQARDVPARDRGHADRSWRSGLRAPVKPRTNTSAGQSKKAVSEVRRDAYRERGRKTGVCSLAALEVD